jgi:hypothetical protein
MTKGLGHRLLEGKLFWVNPYSKRLIELLRFFFEALVLIEQIEDSMEEVGYILEVDQRKLPF